MWRAVLMTGVVLTGIALRIHGLFTEFWLDEIWSLRIAQEASTAWQILFTPHDNNHPLNTLLIRLIGSAASWVPYRLPAFVAGVATIFIVGAAVSDGFERIFAIALVSLSLPMVVYSSEARGYSLAAMAVTLAWLMRRRPWIAAICLAVALFAHLTALYVWLGALAWDVQRRRSLLPHLIPLASAVFLWTALVRKMIVGGGPPSGRLDAAGEALAWTLGGHGLLLGAVAAVLVIAAIRGSEDWVFFAVAIFIAPALALLVHRGEYISPRYFVVLFPFIFMLLARLATRVPRPVAWIALVAWIVASGIQTVPFLQFGRGSYVEALAMIGSGDVSGDNDFRNGTMIDFYARGRVRLEPEGGSDYARTPWFLIASFDREPQLRPRLRTFAAEYRLAGVFRYGGMSGWHWLVYRRVR